jgi:insertion element IS1 protein InsB
MLSKTIVHVCARCGSERIRKNGHAGNGAQRAKCLECQRTFILEPKGPRYPQDFKERVVRAYQDRMSTRGIQRTFGVCYQSLMAWVGGKSGGAAGTGGHALAQPKG